ncbi:PREDICTED: tumor necrosis factor ligand superfamily member 13 isoform X3 [Elephantulus edwardii]|uniref:tumor necrosis factor ligand superfamily member 13 isoform X3 n=1 Tax=Elephantulus edwardii TaxID=28737 RepID=UPI0003F065B4|nr:PREDICTED: tumor necrosis factor ligand superfamily member 13 isoform X3 [Elephantulus edwardii]
MLTSSSSLVAPKGHQSEMVSPAREPALSVALWLSWGAALGAVACALALMTQQTELQTLRREVSWLQRTGWHSRKGEGLPRHSLGAQKHSILHLVPLNITYKEDADVTEVTWQVALRRGRGLEARGHVVRVWDTGIYLLYSQVLFQDVTFTMGQVVTRQSPGKEETLFRCVQSMPSNPDRAYNSCYSAGVFHLDQGDVLSVTIPRAKAKLSLSPHGTFLGLVKL